MHTKIEIKKADNSALPLLYEIAAQMRTSKGQGYFEKSLELQTLEEREVFLAFYEGTLAGYVMLSYQPKYAYYRAYNMPEIQDLNVIPSLRQRGIGQFMVTFCEQHARERGYSKIGIGVGLTASYGAAQRLYVRMGYIPDGLGVTYDRQTVTHGEFRPFDDEISLMMEKEL
jgi:GNAT superfamily N-acetyltransferase